MSEDQRREWRRQALRWLTEQLAEWEHAAGDPTSLNARSARVHLRMCRSDRALAPVRDEAELDKLPEVERAEWRKLWAAFEELDGRLSGAGTRPVAPPPRLVR